MKTRAQTSLCVEWVLRILLGGLFIYAGIQKVRDTQQFTLDVKNYQLLGWIDGLTILPAGITGWSVAIAIAVFLPWLEIIAGAALLVRRFYAGALLIFGVLSAVFLAAILSAWARGLDITCGCFGSSENATNYPQHVTLNVLMMAAVMALAFLEQRRRRGSRTP